MKKEIKQEEIITDLLLFKGYSALSDEERKIIGTHIDKDEYNEMHDLHDKITEALHLEKENVAPDPDIFIQLLQHMDSKDHDRQDSFSWKHFFNHKLPAYQVVAASLFVTVTMYFILLNSGTSETTRIVYKNILDTVYLAAPSGSSIAFNDSGTFVQERSGFSRSKVMEKMPETQTMSLDRFIPEIQEIRMMDVAYKSFAIRN